MANDSQKKHPVEEVYSRRHLLRVLGTGLAAVPVLSLINCSGDSLTGGTGSTGSTGSGSTGSTLASSSSGTSSPSASSSSASSSSTSSSSSSSSSSSGSTGGGRRAWATGGTAAMTAKASYPNPFAGVVQTTCALACVMTEGPCYDSQTIVREDISEGQDGLPLRLLFQILDSDCNPVTDATLDIWHCNPLGVYSGNDSPTENVAFCTGNAAAAKAALWFRGVGATDGNGVIAFDTCFPGWYASRTIHIHLTVRRTTASGSTEFLTTQLFFEDTIDNEIVSTQPAYDSRPSRDTTNLTDTVITAAEVPNYVFKTQQMTDGAMLAWKTLIVRKSTSDASCSIAGSGGPRH